MREDDDGMTSMVWLSPDGEYPNPAGKASPRRRGVLGRQIGGSMGGGQPVGVRQRCAHCCLRGSRHTPVCFTRSTLTPTKSSRSGGQRWQDGQGAPSTPSCSSGVLLTSMKAATETLRGDSTHKRGQYPKESAGFWSMCSEVSPQRPTVATSAFGKVLDTLTRAFTKPTLALWLRDEATCSFAGLLTESCHS